jgi:hypothetical protein
MLRFINFFVTTEIKRKSKFMEHGQKDNHKSVRQTQ